MTPPPQRSPRRTQPLSAAVIVEAATRILDREGEPALTLRRLTTDLGTGYGALYHHVASRGELLAVATDAVLEGVVGGAGPGPGASPPHALRDLALRLYDAIEAHPWVGPQLSLNPWRPALLDVYEGVGRLLTAYGVPERALPDAAGTLVSYVLGATAQNATHASAAVGGEQTRAEALDAIATHWSRLDPAAHPLMHRASARLREHDDREQLVFGIDLFLAGIATLVPGLTPLD